LVSFKPFVYIHEYFIHYYFKMCIIRVGYYYTRTPVGTSHLFRNGPFTQRHQSSSGSPSPYHSYKFCLLASRTAGSPAAALDKNRPVQASNNRKFRLPDFHDIWHM